MLAALDGTDSGIGASLIGLRQLAWGVNVQLRGGFPYTRPRFTKKTFSFATTEQEDWFEDHLLQGADFYFSPAGDGRIVVSAGGRFFAVEPMMVNGAEKWEFTEITPTGATTTTANFTVPAVDAPVAISVTSSLGINIGYPLYVMGKLYVVTAIAGNVVTATNKTDTPTATVNSGATVIFIDPNRPEETTAWMEQAEQYLVIQDGKAAATIYDGATSRRSDPQQMEVPTGTAMVYNEEIGRLAVAVAGNQVAFGDNVNVSEKSVITFEEETVLATGGRFRVPLKYGRITAMEMMANLDRANGQGPMFVFAQLGMTSFNLPAYRQAWQNLTYAVQINMPIRYSATGQAGVVGVNGDIYYRSKDGLRSFRYAVMDFQQPGNVPVSTEMDRILIDDEETLLDRCSAILFDNRIIFTASPAPSRNGVYHRCLGSLDFHLISRMGQKARQVYDGIWTGIHVTKMVVGTFKGRERCMVFALNRDSLENELWELHADVGTDAGAEQNRVQCAIETKAFDFGKPLELKPLDTVFVWMDRIVGEVNVTARYRPDDYHGWFTIGTKNRHTKREDCTTPECKALQTFNRGFRTRIDFGMPTDEPETMDNKPARDFYHVQLRLEWTGEARVRKILVRCGQVQEDVYNLDEPDETSVTERSDSSCLPDDLLYHVV